MTPAARVKALIDILEILANSPVPMDTTIGDYMRVRRYVGSKDRAFIAERAYNIMRAHARLGWVLAQARIADTPRARVAAYFRCLEGNELKRLKDLFDGSKYGADKLEDSEITALEKLKPLDAYADMPAHIRCECPDTYKDVLEAYFGAAFEDEMTAMLTPAALDLRVNIFTSNIEKVEKFLEADGVETTRTAYSPWGLRCVKKAYLSRTKAFAKGWIEIQDEGSQLIAHICDAQPGMQVLDYCAGAGGKSLALGAAMQRKGRIVAMDLEERRLMKGRARYKKASLADIIEVRPLSEERNKKWLRRQKGTFDLVLTDVPCSGTGTWRRNPDMRWRTYGPKLEELLPIQAEILDRVAHTVKPGGRLVYATCSLLPAENEDQVAAFLERQEGRFEIAPLDENKGLGTPFMRLTPQRHGTDGFFAAVLKRLG